VTVRIKCLQCAVRRIAPCGAVSVEAANELARMVHRRRIAAGQIINNTANQTQTFSIIVKGVVKIVDEQTDGHVQIVGLQFPSDFVGRPYADSAKYLAEAATDLEVCSFAGPAFENLMHVYPDLELSILKRTLDDLDQARQWMSLIARKTAEERVAGLLLFIADKLQANNADDAEPSNSVEFNLPLSRTEFAECLNLRLETVSRQFAALKAEGIIKTNRRRALQVCDLAGLKARAQVQHHS
jgi:CRP/FNR family transcriptional regulator